MSLILRVKLLRPILFDPFDELQGDWTREQLLAMDDRFVAAVEAAIQAGDESLVAARATYVVNGKQRAEAVIESAWRYLLTNMDEGKDVAFAEILGRCSGVAPERVREGFRRRLTSWVGEGAMTNDREKLQVEEERGAGRRRLARGQVSDLAETGPIGPTGASGAAGASNVTGPTGEVEAGRCWAARSRARLELEQAAGRRTARVMG